MAVQIFRFLILWPSSQINRSAVSIILNPCNLKESYDVTRTYHLSSSINVFILSITCLLSPWQIKNFILPLPNHFHNSFYQWYTREDGTTTRHLWALVTPVISHSFNITHINAIAYIVLPKPIISAKIHPLILLPCSALIQLYKNLTPWT